MAEDADTLEIRGKVFVPGSPMATTYATAGKVYLYTEDDLTVPKDSCCLNANHCYEFENLEPGTYYVYVKEAMHCPGVITSNAPIYKSSSMAEVVLTTRSVNQDLTATVSTGRSCDSHCGCIRGCPNYR